MASGTPPDDARIRTGERRHLTVMFCDLVGSSRLAAQVDVEDWRDIVADYHRAGGAVVRRFDGYVAQELGDGFIAYFGWPVAHEDDAYRACRAGLGVVDAMQVLNARLEREHRLTLHVRVGIDTGTVVVDVGDREHATGNALNVASRLQVVANPDSVVISGPTFDLVRGYFTCEDLGAQHLKNVEDAVHVYRVVAESGAANRLDAAADRGLTPFIGREFELNTLLKLWERTKERQSQTVHIRGDAGIGKSRLVKNISEQIGNVVVLRCSPINSNSALFPVISHLERWLELDQLADPQKKLERVEHRLQRFGFPPSGVALLASEFSLPSTDRYPLPNLSVQDRRQQTLKVLVQWLLKEAEEQPLMAVWEDLHWADPSTIELLGLVIEQASKTPTPLLTLLTFRPEFRPPWTTTASFTELALGRLKPLEVEDMLRRITRGRELPVQVVNQIVDKTEGVPLFVEELLRTVLDTGIVRPAGSHYVMARPAAPLAIPATLEGSLMSRLDRLGAAKAIAQRGAVLGRAFSQDLIRAVVEAEVPHSGKRGETWKRTQQCLTTLVDAGVLRRRRAPRTTYEFKHALIQDAAYGSLLKRTRQAYHLQTAQVIEAQFAQLIATQPEVVAHHFTEASQHEKALDYWQKAGERARDRSANKEAIHHFDKALAIARTLPHGESRDRHELALLVASLTPLIAVEGYVAPKTARTVDDALGLGQKLGENLGEVKGLFPVLYVQWVTRLVRANYTEALRLSADFVREAQSQRDTAPRLMGHRLHGFSMFIVGEGDLREAREHLKQALELYDDSRHADLKNQGYGQDPRCACEAFMALVQWLRGFPDDAAEWTRRSLKHSSESPIHSNTWGYVRCFGATTAEIFARNVPAAQQHAAELLAFSEENELPVWMAYSRVLHGWTLAQTGQVDDGVAQIKKGLADFDCAPPDEAARLLGRAPQGMGFMKSFLLWLLADAYIQLGRTEEASTVIEEAVAFAEGRREGFWKAELQRLRGALLLSRDQSSRTASFDAEASLVRARDLAAMQGAKSLELRAATSLGRLWSREKPEEARRVLSEAYAWFTEGFESPDLREARLLLNALQEAGT